MAEPVSGDADLQVVDYLAGIRAARQGEEKTAEFNAVVLVRRGGLSGEWVVREPPVRRLRRCDLPGVGYRPNRNTIS